MRYYYWKGSHANGQIMIGYEKANHSKEIYQRMIKANITPLVIKQHFSPRIALPFSFILDFTQQLSLLLNANISLPQALTALASIQKNHLLKEIIQQLQQYLNAGISLSQALAYFPVFFDATYCTFIETGESTGQLAKTIRELSHLQQRQHHLKNQIKRALSYPLFLLACTFIISLGVLLYIIPQYQSFFSELGGSLPALTRQVLYLTHLLNQQALPLLITLFASIVMGKIILKKPGIKLKTHQFLLCLPLIKKIITQVTLSRWTYLLAISCQTQVPLLSAVTLANRTILNHYLALNFQQISAGLTSGMSLYECLQQIVCIPAPVVQMIKIGESTGTLSIIFHQLAQNQQEVLTVQLNQLIKFVEPLIMLLLALLTGILIAALYLPMVNIGLNL